LIWLHSTDIMEIIKDFDIILEISDKTRKCNIRAHKIILFVNSVWFQRIFIDNQSITKIPIIVPNTMIVYDIIRSFYNQSSKISLPKWQYTIESIIGRCFFELSVDLSQLQNLNIPLDTTDTTWKLLLQLFDFVGPHDDLIRLIMKYNGYKTPNFPVKLINAINIINRVDRLNFISASDLITVTIRHDDGIMYQCKADRQLLYLSSTVLATVIEYAQENNLTSIEIFTKYAASTYDFIQMIHRNPTNIDQLPQWQHTLELNIACAYFNWHWSRQDQNLANLNIPHTGLELLMHAFETIHFDNIDIVHLIYKTISNNQI